MQSPGSNLAARVCRRHSVTIRGFMGDSVFPSSPCFEDQCSPPCFGSRTASIHRCGVLLKGTRTHRPPLWVTQVVAIFVGPTLGGCLLLSVFSPLVRVSGPRGAYWPSNEHEDRSSGGLKDDLEKQRRHNISNNAPAAPFSLLPPLGLQH